MSVFWLSLTHQSVCMEFPLQAWCRTTLSCVHSGSILRDFTSFNEIFTWLDAAIVEHRRRSSHTRPLSSAGQSKNILEPETQKLWRKKDFFQHASRCTFFKRIFFTVRKRMKMPQIFKTWPFAAASPCAHFPARVQISKDLLDFLTANRVLLDLLLQLDTRNELVVRRSSVWPPWRRAFYRVLDALPWSSSPIWTDQT